MSTLGRLFLYAKATGAEALENFTTEALAGAIRAEPAPFLLALRNAALIDDHIHDAVGTQVPLSALGPGRHLDLVLAVRAGTRRRSLWFEVKMHHDVSGDQLEAYSKYVESFPQDERPTLAALSPKRLAPHLPWLSWQDVRRAILASRTTCPAWLDLKTHLEETRMADAYSEPFEQSELSGLRSTQTLLRKTARVLVPFATEALQIWKDSNWPTSERHVQDALAKVLVSHGALSISGRTRYRAHVSAGVYHEPSTGDAWLGLWLWAKPSWFAERDRVYRQADQGGLGSEWDRSPADWEFLGHYRRLSEFASQAEATSWLVERLRELDRAQVLALLPKLGALPDDEDDDGGGEG